MLVLQQIWYRLRLNDDKISRLLKNRKKEVVSLNKTVIDGIIFDDELTKKYLFHKFLDKHRND